MAISVKHLTASDGTEVEVKAAEYANKSTVVIVPDTRNTNPSPSWYYSNYASKIITEFKRADDIGLTGQSFFPVTTYVAWVDLTGGNVFQVVYSYTDNRCYMRSGNSDKWSAWTAIDLRYQIQSANAITTSGWDTANHSYIPNMAFMSLWNGAYQGTISNLRYSANGEIIGTNNIRNQSVSYSTHTGYTDHTLTFAPNNQAFNGSSNVTISPSNMLHQKASYTKDPIYYKIATCASSKTGYGSILMDGFVGGFFSYEQNLIHLNIANRGGEAVTGSISGRLNPKGNYTNILLYAESDSTSTVWLKLTGYYAYAFTLLNNNNAADVYNETAGTPTGTLKWALFNDGCNAPAYGVNGSLLTFNDNSECNAKAASVQNSLSFGRKSYNGSSAQTVTLEDLGLTMTDKSVDYIS